MNKDERIFIGLDLSQHLVNTIPMIRSTIKDKRQLIKWVSGRNLHLTLSFIGQANSEEIGDLSSLLQKISTFSAFDITVSGTGFFLNEDSPRALWLGIEEGKTKLKELHEEVASIASSFISEDKKEDFIPHITIGRINPPNKNFDLSTFSNAVYSDIKISIKTVYLFKSQLLESGVRYSAISEYKLNN